MKRIVTLLLAALMLLSVCGTAVADTEPPTRTFTDSVGRTVELPAAIDKVAVSGPLAQIVLFALCPDRLVGIASPWDATAEQYLKTEGEILYLTSKTVAFGRKKNPLDIAFFSGAKLPAAEFKMLQDAPKDTVAVGILRSFPPPCRRRPRWAIRTCISSCTTSSIKARSPIRRKTRWRP